MAHAILAARGEGEEPIALLMERDAPLIAALEPSFPPDRLGYLLKDSGASLIVTDRRHLPLAEIVAGDGIPTLDVDALDSSLSAANPGVALTAGSRSCLLYTSGSTGQPKGVLQNHRNVLHRIMSYTNALHICPEDRWVYPGRVILFRAREQPERYRGDPQLGWAGLAAGGLDIHEIPGDHYTMWREPHVRVLAERLRDCLG